MRQRQLGKDGPMLSVIGLGGWKFAGSWVYGLGRIDDATSLATIDCAIEHGINWIDTAPVYGEGRSEEVIGRALVGRDDVLINTKCGHYLSADGKSTFVDNSPARIKRECEVSLRRLGRDHIDIYQFHLPDAHHPVDDSWAAMLELVDEGKVRWPGASNFGVELLGRCEALGHVQVTEPQYNVMHREIETDLLPWCAEHGTGVVCYETQQTGLLSGAFSRKRLEALPQDDFRRGFADFQEPELSRALDLVDQLRPLAGQLGATVGELAIAFAISNTAVTGAIVGAGSPQQVDGIAGAGDLVLTNEVVEQIRALAERAGYGVVAQTGYSAVDPRVSGISDSS
jgi:aryl-alcohol dehydrogenase-like predicted oxidoreductase